MNTIEKVWSNGNILMHYILAYCYPDLYPHLLSVLLTYRLRIIQDAISCRIRLVEVKLLI